ncbi:hypothetical protein ACFWAP_22740, partial [Streptomyces goshikiensis]
MSLKWWRGQREEPSAATAGPASPAGTAGSGAPAPGPADAPDPHPDRPGTHDPPAPETGSAENGAGFAE